jgi:hypothetical protein
MYTFSGFTTLFAIFAWLFFVQAQVELLYIDKSCLLKPEFSWGWNTAVANLKDMVRRFDDENDKDFETIINNVWHVDRKPVNKDKWNQIKSLFTLDLERVGSVLTHLKYGSKRFLHGILGRKKIPTLKP